MHIKKNLLGRKSFKEIITITQDNLTIIISLSLLQDKTRVVIYNNTKITKQYQNVKRTMSMNDWVNICLCHDECIKNAQLQFLVM